jgi:hypothetical protein
MANSILDYPTVQQGTRRPFCLIFETEKSVAFPVLSRKEDHS